MSADHEKKDAELGATTYSSSNSNEHVPDYTTSDEANSQLSFWTRMGCTPESFKRRTLEDKINQLNQTLKKRHLHMIAVSFTPQLDVGINGTHTTNTALRLVAPLALGSSSDLAVR